MCPPARFRCDAGEPAWRGRIPSIGREAAQRRDGLVLGSVGPGVRPLREAGQSGDAGDRRPLYRARLGFLQAGEILGERCGGLSTPAK